MSRTRTDRAAALQYRDGDSWLHRLSPGVKLLGVLALSALAVASAAPWALAALGLAGLAGYGSAGLGPRALWRDTRYLLAQGLIVATLYVLRDGLAAGLGPGLRVSLQIVLFFLPGLLMLRTTRLGDLVSALERVLPRRWAFVVGASLRFVPLFARELGEIADAQRLRGAELSWRALRRARGWRDWLHCVGTPLVVRAIQVADEAALSAEGRGLAAGPGSASPAYPGIRIVRIAPHRSGKPSGEKATCRS